MPRGLRESACRADFPVIVAVRRGEVAPDRAFGAMKRPIEEGAHVLHPATRFISAVRIFRAGRAAAHFKESLVCDGIRSS
jgi:hypothetical protein